MPALALLGLGVLAAPARAQIGGDLPTGIVQADGLDDAAKASLEKYIQDRKDGLSKDADDEVQKAREALIEPLVRAGVRPSPAFRLAYAPAIEPVLRAQLQDKVPDMRAINALVIAGQLGTQQGADLLQLGMRSKSVSVRYAAAAGLANTLVLARGDIPAIRPEAVEALAASLERLIASEPDTKVLGALVRAAGEGLKIARPPEVARISGEGACRGLMARKSMSAKTPMDDAESQALLACLAHLRDLAGGRLPTQPGDTTLKAAAQLSAQFLNQAGLVLQSNAMSSAVQRDAYGRLSEAAVALVNVCGQRLDSAGFKAAPVELGKKLRVGNARADGEFLNEAKGVIDSVARPPFK